MRQRNLVSIAVRALSVVAVLVAFVAVAPAAFAKPQDKCPVMGGDIDKSVFVDYEGQRVYFCCPGCIGKFKADPATYLAKLKADGVELEKSPASAATAASASSEAKSCGCGDGKTCAKDCACGCGCKDGKPCTCGDDCSCHKGGEKHGCQKAEGEKKDCGCGK